MVGAFAQGSVFGNNERIGLSSMSRLFRALVVLAVLAAALTAFVKFVFVREDARRRLFPFMRPLYQHVLNPYALRTAAHGESEWGVLHHVGRRSGVVHHTPIDAQLTQDGVVIPLVYGSSADWCRNILAAGACTLTLHGDELALSDPQIVAMHVAAAQVSPDKARFWRSIGIEHCVSLKIASSARPG
jgi:hypothetical protein